MPSSFGIITNIFFATQCTKTNIGIVGLSNNEIIGAHTTPRRRTLGSYTSACGKTIRCVAIGSSPITTCNN